MPRIGFVSYAAIAIASLMVIWLGTLYLTSGGADRENGWFIVGPGTVGLIWSLFELARLMDHMDRRLRDLESEEK